MTEGGGKMVFACSKHLIRVIREVGKPTNNYTVTVMPVGDEWVCGSGFCGKKAAWGVNPA